jgi:peptidoglycan hydrolase-like protein with peptidoglycan-binding domain
MPAPKTILAPKASGSHVKTLQAQLRSMGLTVSETESHSGRYGPETEAAVREFQLRFRLTVTGRVDEFTESMLSTCAAARKPDKHLVSGSLTMDYGLPAGMITVRLYGIGFAGAASRLSQASSNALGAYSLAYTPPSSEPGLEVRALNPAGKEVILSSVFYHAPKLQVLNLVVPATVKPLAPEYQRIAADMKKAAGGIQNLARAKETAGQRDLTLLNQSTGWDARLLALAAISAQQAAETGIDQEALYALYRTGLPTDPQKLALVPTAAVSTALSKANESGIVGLNPDQIASALASFGNFSAKSNLSLKVVGAPSTFADLLGTTIADAKQRSAFTAAFFDPTVTGEELWTAAKAAGISAETIATLKVHGKLAFLTYNNAPLIQALQNKLGSVADPGALADADYHLDATWISAINSLAGNDTASLQSLIPEIYGGDSVGEQLAAYAAELARKVRVSFPTRVVARMAETGSLNLNPNQAPAVGAFMRAASIAGYQLGQTPLNSFLARLPEGVPAPDPDTVASVKTLHRLYQITPSNESLQAALGLGFESARDIAKYGPEEFMLKYGGSFPSTQEAQMVLQKAQQVAAVTLNLFNSAKQLDTQPAIFALSASQQRAKSAKAAIAQQFPSMASLFGSLDYCECQDCRSILSPAAYLVDLLHFLDPNAADWAKTLSTWKTAHNNQDYPYAGTPFAALTTRRPDLPNLNLSCENTNTALPYIDVVNEILEYFVANQASGGLQNMAYDTGSANSADLIAEPQNILPQAYSILANRVAATPSTYPLSLPIDLWIETVRGFLGYFKIPLTQILETFRPADFLELLDNTQPYNQASIFLESLDFSPIETALLTSGAVLGNWYNLYGYNDQATALGSLTSAATLANALGITYQNLADILETGFLNPALVLLANPLETFGLSLRDVFTYTGQAGYDSPALTAAQKAAFETMLQGLMAQKYPANDPKELQNWLNSFLTSGYSNSVLLLLAPSENACDFANTIFQYAGGNAATSLDFLKLNFFVRVWKKLDWPIDEVDRALELFLAPWLPAGGDATLGADFASAVPSALIYLSHLQTLFTELQPGSYGRAGILPLWTGIPVTGENPLYAQLFLTDAVLNNDPIFDSPVGQYLCYLDPVHGYQPFRWPPALPNQGVADGYVLLNDHITALQGSLGLTAGDIASILSDNGYSILSAPLTLDIVSLLYRYSLLSQGLQISIDDFIALKLLSIDAVNTPPLSKVNPFDNLSANPLSKLSDDHPWGETIQFAQQWSAVQATGFSIPDLQYLLCHQVVDPAGPYAPDDAAMMQQVRSLSAVIRAIASQTAVPSDPTAFNDDLIRQKMSQVLPASAAQTFMGMWSGTIQYTASPIATFLPQAGAVFANDTFIQFLSTATTQTVVLQGVPTAAVLGGLASELANLVADATITPAQQALVQGLLDDIQTQALTFFQTYLEASTAGGQPSGFLLPGDFDTLFSAPAGNASSRQELAAAFLPYLQSQLVRQAVLQSAVAQLGASAMLTETLLAETTVLFDPTQPAIPPTALLEAYKASADFGVSVTYFSDSSEIAVAGAATLPTADTSQASNPPKPPGVNSVQFEGHIEVPADGQYLFTVILPNNTSTATLQFDTLGAPLPLNTGIPLGSPATYGPTKFQAGIPCHFKMDIQGLSGGDASVLIQGENLPQGPLGQIVLYPETSVQRFSRAQILLTKTWQLVRGFNLNENELVYLVTHAADFGGLSFYSLPTQAIDYTVAGAQVLFGQFLRLANYAALRQGPGGGTDGLISVFQNARQTFPASPLPPNFTTPIQFASQNFFQALASVTRRDPDTLKAVILQLWGDNVIAVETIPASQPQFQFTVAPLVNDLGFGRLWSALQLVQTLGVQPQTLAQTTRIVHSGRAAVSTIADEGSAIASSLRNAVKSQYTPDQWRPVAQSVMDPLRQMKRDALSGYLLTLPAIIDFGATDSNGLFEYFLVDPGMEPVVQTSRIRLALSSVQTFVQRCLLNLEPGVMPSIINSGYWDWMKRYRVWEANREIFLWPENWLIPEFRENATDLFQALQGTLLQGDITQDVVEQAFTQYLQDLDTRARLDIVSLFNQPPDLSAVASTNTLHVVGRHHGKPAKYFYRTYADTIWNGWIPVTPDIEGDHIAVVVWRGRPMIFWLTFIIKGGPTAPTGSGSNSDGTGATTNLNQLTVADLSSALAGSSAPPTTVQVQLNWTEYYQGKWAPRKSSDVNRFAPVSVEPGFDPVRDVLVHVSVDSDDQGNETAVRIHMDGDDLFRTFRLTGKNSEPSCAQFYWFEQGWVEFIYNSTGFTDATKYVGYLNDPDGAGPEGTPSFVVRAANWQMTTTNGTLTQASSGDPLPILSTVNSYNLLFCDNVAPYPANWASSALFSDYLTLATAQSQPFFYEDTADPNANEEMTFFVQPVVSEVTMSHVLGWVIKPTFLNLNVYSPKYWGDIALTSQTPTVGPSNPPDPDSIASYRTNVDAVLADSNVISYGDIAIGQKGGAIAAARANESAAGVSLEANRTSELSTLPLALTPSSQNRTKTAHRAKTKKARRPKN